MQLDAIDRQLLRLLQADGRMSYADMAQEVGLTAPAVRTRVQRLQDQGVVQIIAVTDPIALGYREAAIVGVRVDGDVRKVADAAGAIENVVYLVTSVGGYDLIGEIVCEDREAFAAVVARMRSIRGVRSVDAFPYTGIHTHRFTWGVPER